MAQVNFISATKLVELLTEANELGRMNVRVLSADQIALGVDPLHPSKVIDLSNEVVRPLERGQGQKPIAPPLSSPSQPTIGGSSQRSSRTTGKYYLEIKGDLIECRSLKEVLAEGLRAFEKLRPGTLEKLSAISPRSKRIVAQQPELLFKKNPELVEKCTERLVGDWWYGTNNSAAETKAWLKRGAECCGLTWDVDVTISL